MSLAVLVVCTGNVCRSPLAAQLLVTRLNQAGVEALVRSAGTAALTGQPMTPEAAESSRRYGGDPRGHAAMQLSEGLIDDSDLVLTASREHRAAVASLVPRAARRAYTLREFARVVDHLEADPESVEALESVASLEEFLGLVSMSRGYAVPPRDPADDDIVDPYGRSIDVYEQAGRVIDAATMTAARAMATASRFGSRGAA